MPSQISSSCCSIQEQPDQVRARLHLYNTVAPAFYTKEQMHIAHTHISLTDLKAGIANRTLDDNRLLEIYTHAKIDLLKFKLYENGIYDPNYSEKHNRPLSNKEMALLFEAINEDIFIVQICERELLKINSAS